MKVQGQVKLNKHEQTVGMILSTMGHVRRSGGI